MVTLLEIPPQTQKVEPPFLTRQTILQEYAVRYWSHVGFAIIAVKVNLDRRR